MFREPLVYVAPAIPSRRGMCARRRKVAAQLECRGAAVVVPPRPSVDALMRCDALVRLSQDWAGDINGVGASRANRDPLWVAAQEFGIPRVALLPSDALPLILTAWLTAWLARP